MSVCRDAHAGVVAARSPTSSAHITALPAGCVRKRILLLLTLLKRRRRSDS